LPEGQARSVMLQILNGLDYLHNNNILFRDIKLENILFDANGRIKITDFGLSKPEVDEDEITYSYCGSPEYMAPEMLTKYLFFHSDLDTLTKLIFTPLEFFCTNFSSEGLPSTHPKKKIFSMLFSILNQSFQKLQL